MYRIIAASYQEFSFTPFMPSFILQNEFLELRLHVYIFFLFFPATFTAFFAFYVILIERKMNWVLVMSTENL